MNLKRKKKKDVDGNKRAEDTPACHKWNREMGDAQWGIAEEECGSSKGTEY